MKNSFDIPIYTIYNYQYLDIPMYNPDITHRYRYLPPIFSSLSTAQLWSQRQQPQIR